MKRHAGILVLAALALWVPHAKGATAIEYGLLGTWLEVGITNTAFAQGISNGETMVLAESLTDGLIAVPGLRPVGGKNTVTLSLTPSADGNYHLTGTIAPTNCAVTTGTNGDAGCAAITTVDLATDMPVGAVIAPPGYECSLPGPR